MLRQHARKYVRKKLTLCDINRYKIFNKKLSRPIDSYFIIINFLLNIILVKIFLSAE